MYSSDVFKNIAKLIIMRIIIDFHYLVCNNKAIVFFSDFDFAKLLLKNNDYLKKIGFYLHLEELIAQKVGKPVFVSTFTITRDFNLLEEEGLQKDSIEINMRDVV